MKNFEKNIISIYADQGKQWLSDLPNIVSSIAKTHNLTGLSPEHNMHFNYITHGYQNNTAITLKISLDEVLLERESIYLKAYKDKDTVVKIIANASNMIIMERAIPGITLKKYFPNKDIEATIILCDLIKKLHSVSIPTHHSFNHIANLLKTIEQSAHIPNNILRKAKNIKNNLLNSTKKEVLLHGDLHHENILKNGNKWIVIDPKGFVGDPAFELATYICNPITELLQEDNVKQMITKRIAICNKKLGISKQRILDWTYVKSVLCLSWSIEDNSDVIYWKNFLHLIDTFKT